MQQLEAANTDTQQLYEKQSASAQLVAQLQEKARESEEKMHALVRHGEQADAQLAKAQGRVDRLRAQMAAQQRDYEAAIETLRGSGVRFDLVHF